MRSKVWFLVFICIVLIPFKTFAEDKTSQIEQLNYLSDEALQLTKSHRYEDAKKILEIFSDKFTSISLKKQSLTMDELRIVTIAHNDAVEATTNATMNPDERINEVTKFRLVIDAISSTKEPLWRQMEEPILTVFSDVKNSALNGDNTAFQQNLNSFLSLYNIVYPSMKIDVSTEQLQKLDAKVKFIDHYRIDVLKDQEAKKELTSLEYDLQSVFDNLLEDETDPSLWWVIISTGSIIIITLSYVGWRKFIGEKERRKNPSR